MRSVIVKVVAGLAAAAVLVPALAVGGLAARWPPSFPDTPYPDVEASDDPAVIARGEYLFHAVAHCSACHAPRETIASGRAAPIGGAEWQMGPIGTLRSRNLTPDPQTGLTGWTDAELARVIRTGINRDHEPAPLMIAAGAMSDEDLAAVISYMRSLEPVRHEVPPTEMGLLGKVMLPLAMPGFVAPRELEAPPFVSEGEISVARGRYLAEGPAACVSCHSAWVASPKLAFVGPLFAGNPEPDPVHGEPDMEMVAPNLTRHPTGALSKLDEDAFVARMRGGPSFEGTKMPWVSYRHMTDEDLRSIYRYLASLPPVERDVGPTYREAGWSP